MNDAAIDFHFFIECAKCHKKSPPVTTSVTPPAGWSIQVTGKGQTITTFICQECKP